MSVRVAVIGVGYWGPNLVRNFVKRSDCTVVAISDLKEDRLQLIKRLYPFVETTTDADSLLGRKDIDAVAIVTPVSTHYPLALKGLQAGKSVLVAKPLTQTAAQAEELIREAERQKRVLMVDHTFIFSGPVRAIRQLIQANQVGEIYSYDSTRINLGLFQHDVNVVWDLGPHDLSIMTYLLGKNPVRVAAVGARPLNYVELESVAYVTAHFDDGMIAHLHLSWLSPVKIRRSLICGTKKMIVYDHLDPDNQVKVYDKGVDVHTASDKHSLLVQYRAGDMYAPKIDQGEPLEAVCRHFLECIQQGTRPVTDGVAGLDVVRQLEAIQTSMTTGGSAVAV